MNTSQTTVIKPHSSFYFLNFQDLWNFRELFVIFAWRDLKVRYKQTAIGVAWVIFQPLVSMVVFTVFFGNLAKIPSQDLPYPVFVLLGLIFWTFFSSSLSHAANSFIENTSVINKVYFPREILPFAAVLVGIIDFLVSLSMFVVVSLLFGVAWNLAFVITLIFGLIITYIAATGLGIFLAAVNVKYRDVRYILPFFLQLMLFVTPVIYPLNIVRPSFQFLLQLNPMAGIINSLRLSLATGEFASGQMLLFSALTALAVFFLGLFYFRKTHSYFADVL